MILLVEVLKLKRIRIIKPLRCGGGALGTRMNLFDRFARVVKVKSLNNNRFSFISLAFDNLIVVVIFMVSNAVVRKCNHKFL